MSLCNEQIMQINQLRKLDIISQSREQKRHFPKLGMKASFPKMTFPKSFQMQFPKIKTGTSFTKNSNENFISRVRDK